MKKLLICVCISAAVGMFGSALAVPNIANMQLAMAHEEAADAQKDMQKDAVEKADVMKKDPAEVSSDADADKADADTDTDKADTEDNTAKDKDDETKTEDDDKE